MEIRKAKVEDVEQIKIGVIEMTLKSRLPFWTWLAISIVAVIVCDVLNFSDMAYGNGTLSSFVVSIAYALLWAALVFINHNDRKFLIFFTVFSFICVAAGLLGFGISSDMISQNGILAAIGFLGLLFITPLYGLRFLINSNSFDLLYTALISLYAVCVIVGFVLIKKSKQATSA